MNNNQFLDVTQYVGLAQPVETLSTILFNNLGSLRAGKASTSGERSNCSIHSGVMSLFSYLLDPATTREQQEAILNNQPVSFIDKFNAIHGSNLTVAEFMDWVSSHRNGTKFDRGFIEMLAPSVRLMIVEMHNSKMLTEQDVHLFERGSDQFSGMLSETAFNYMFLMFGVPFVVEAPRGPERFGRIDSYSHTEFNVYKVPVRTFEGVVLLVHQNRGLTHFETIGSVTRQGADAGMCRYISAHSAFSGPHGYRESNSKALALINSSENQDYVQTFLQSDIRRYFGAHRCDLYHLPANHSLDFPDDFSESDMLSILSAVREDQMIDIQVVRHFAPELSLQDCDILAQYINVKLEPGNREEFARLLQGSAVDTKRIILDILISLSIIGLPYVIYQNVVDPERARKCGGEHLIDCLNRVSSEVSAPKSA